MLPAEVGLEDVLVELLDHFGGALHFEFREAEFAEGLGDLAVVKNHVVVGELVLVAGLLHSYAVEETQVADLGEDVLRVEGLPHFALVGLDAANEMHVTGEELAHQVVEL